MFKNLFKKKQNDIPINDTPQESASITLVTAEEAKRIVRDDSPKYLEEKQAQLLLEYKCWAEETFTEHINEVDYNIRDAALQGQTNIRLFARDFWSGKPAQYANWKFPRFALLAEKLISAYKNNGFTVEWKNYLIEDPSPLYIDESFIEISWEN